MAEMRLWRGATDRRHTQKGHSERRSKGGMLTVHHMTVTLPYPFEPTGFFVPNEEIPIIAARTDFV